MVRLAIDFENPSQSWWDNGGRDLWEGLVEGFGENHIVVDESIANSWLAEAAKIPGWEGGPEYAPHPVCLKEVAEDEDV
jgi:hypothetical protein